MPWPTNERTIAVAVGDARRPRWRAPMSPRCCRAPRRRCPRSIAARVDLDQLGAPRPARRRRSRSAPRRRASRRRWRRRRPRRSGPRGCGAGQGCRGRPRRRSRRTARAGTGTRWPGTPMNEGMPPAARMIVLGDGVELERWSRRAGLAAPTRVERRRRRAGRRRPCVSIWAAALEGHAALAERHRQARSARAARRQRSRSAVTSSMGSVAADRDRARRSRRSGRRPRTSAAAGVSRRRRIVSGRSSARWSSGAPSMSQTPGTCAAGATRGGRRGARRPVQTRRPASRSDELVRGDLDVQGRARRARHARASESVERLGLGSGAREAVEDRARGGVGLAPGAPRSSRRSGRRARGRPFSMYVRDLGAERRAVPERCAEQVAGRHVGQPELSGEATRLGPLAGPGAPTITMMPALVAASAAAPCERGRPRQRMKPS